jgi:molybdopterin/thiamine biosynthesis adenylyltransferase
MSGDDVQSAHKLIPRFQSDIPRRSHGSVVLGDDSVAGLLWLPQFENPVSNFELRAFDSSILTLPLPPHSDSDLLLHRRQPLAFTEFSRGLLRRTTVVVVGISGGGTQLVTQLAAAGVGRIIAIDNQRLDGENGLTTDAVSWLDLLLKRSKLRTARRNVWWINPSCKFECINSLVPEREALEALKRSDVIVGCVNNLAAKADILEIGGRYCIPYIDIGLTLRTADDASDPAPIIAIAGNVFVNVPGEACLWCSGYLTNKKLKADVGGSDRSYLKLKLGAASKRDVLVSPLNGVLANQAACEVLQLILGYAPVESVGVLKKYDGYSGTLTEWEVNRRPDCPHCQNVIASGDPVWS